MVKIPAQQHATADADICASRQHRERSHAELGELTGWPGPSTVCAADGRQRGSTAPEGERLAAIAGISAWRLMTRCATSGGCPPTGFACPARGTTTGTGRPGITRHPARHGAAAACR
jgi:hypothetical protein